MLFEIYLFIYSFTYLLPYLFIYLLNLHGNIWNFRVQLLRAENLAPASAGCVNSGNEKWMNITPTCYIHGLHMAV